jgi:hypothetical protein
MILIAHRGNTNGKFESYENEPNYIDMAIKKGFDVEIDIWCIDNQIYLGHDEPQYGIDFRWLRDRIKKLWIHCKNLEALVLLKNCGYDVNYFWHQEDDFTITSMGYFWTYPGKELSSNSVAVMPETKEFKDIEKAYAICSDYVEKIKLDSE